MIWQFKKTFQPPKIITKRLIFKRLPATSAMSRPQYGQYQQSGSPVVNGGLIDFQDNQHRGLAEYGAFSGIGPNPAYPVPNVSQAATLHPYMLAGPAGLPPAPFQPIFPHPPGVAGPYMPPPAPAQHTVQSNGPAVPSQYAVTVPAPSNLVPTHHFNVNGQPQTGQSGQYVNGPPSFVQINGVKYRPVDDLPTQGSVSAASNVAPGPVETEVAVMSEQELEDAIDRRVQQRVDAFVAGQRRNVSTDEEAGTPRRSPSVSSSSKRVEEKMAKQVASVNASMRASAQPVVVKRGW